MALPRPLNPAPATEEEQKDLTAKRVKQLSHLMEKMTSLILDTNENNLTYNKKTLPKYLIQFHTFIHSMDQKTLTHLYTAYIKDDTEVDLAEIESAIPLFKNRIADIFSDSPIDDNLKNAIKTFVGFLEALKPLAPVNKETSTQIETKESEISDYPTVATIIVDYHSNLEVRPNIDDSEKLNPEHVLTLGDRHGNALNLIQPFVRHQVIDIDEKSYAELVRIYNTDVPDPKNKESDPTFDAKLKSYIDDMATFDRILDTAFEKVDPKNIGKVRLLGDLISDRGKNDYFNFRIIECLSQKKLIKEIIYSNHDYDGITSLYNMTYPNNKLALWFQPEDNRFKESFINLTKLIDLGAVSLEKINKLVYTHYFPYLKIIGYAPEEQDNKQKNLTIFTHAPTKFIDSLTVAAKELLHDAKFDPSNLSLPSLINTIDQFNKTALGSTINESETKPYVVPFINDRIANLEFKNSAEAKTAFPPQIDDYRITYTSGHDASKVMNEYLENPRDVPYGTLLKMLQFKDKLYHTCSLDNILGKKISPSKENSTGIYFTKLSHEPLELELIFQIEINVLPTLKNSLSPTLYDLFKGSLEVYEENKDHKTFLESWKKAGEFSLEMLKTSSTPVSPHIAHSLLSPPANPEVMQLTKTLNEADQIIDRYMKELMPEAPKPVSKTSL
jgi:hypothetical protein